MNTTPKALTDALKSIEIPITQFIETGIYTNPFAMDEEQMPQEVKDSSGFVSDTQTQRICRMVAKELKRPFIIMTPVIMNYEWRRVNGQYRRVDVNPTFRHTYIHMPKRKYLTPLVTPLLLAAGNNVGGSYLADKHPDIAVWAGREKTNWQFFIRSEQLWNEYREALDRPEMRIARRMQPL